MFLFKSISETFALDKFSFIISVVVSIYVVVYYCSLIAVDEGRVLALVFS